MSKFKYHWTIQLGDDHTPDIDFQRWHESPKFQTKNDSFKLHWQVVALQKLFSFENIQLELLSCDRSDIQVRIDLHLNNTEFIGAKSALIKDTTDAHITLSVVKCTLPILAWSTKQVVVCVDIELMQLQKFNAFCVPKLHNDLEAFY